MPQDSAMASDIFEVKKIVKRECLVPVLVSQLKNRSAIRLEQCLRTLLQASIKGSPDNLYMGGGAGSPDKLLL